jgi:hypothetical protein
MKQDNMQLHIDYNLDNYDLDDYRVFSQLKTSREV